MRSTPTSLTAVESGQPTSAKLGSWSQQESKLAASNILPSFSNSWTNAQGKVNIHRNCSDELAFTQRPWLKVGNVTREYRCKWPLWIVFNLYYVNEFATLFLLNFVTKPLFLISLVIILHTRKAKNVLKITIVIFKCLLRFYPVEYFFCKAPE